jgi:hypothetical protein
MREIHPNRSPAAVLSLLWRWCARFATAAIWISLLLIESPLAAGNTNLALRWSSPAPFGNDVADLAYRSNRVYTAVCDHGQVYVSDDALSWRRRSPGVTNSLRCVTYMGNRILAGGANGAILWSDDEYFTTVDLLTTDWLEGAAASTNLAVAVGDHAAIYISSDGASWSRINPGFTNWLRSVAYGGGTFAAVGEKGLIATSVDGQTWKRRSIPGLTAGLNRVVWDGSRFAAVGERGTAITSTDATGITWRAIKSTGATNDLFALAFDSSGTELAVGDGVVFLGAVTFANFQWTSETSSGNSPAPAATYLCALWDGSKILLGAEAGVIVSGQGPDASGHYDWTYDTNSVHSSIWDMTVASTLETNRTPYLSQGQVSYQTNQVTNTFYAAVGDDAVLLQSSSGAFWPLAFAPASAAGLSYYGIGASSNLLAAVGSAGTISISPNIYASVIVTNYLTNGPSSAIVITTNSRSTMGLAWYAAKSPVKTDLQGICFSNGVYVATGDAGVILTSADGTNWVTRKSGLANFLSSIATWPGGWIAVGSAGSLVTSSDAVNWVSKPLPTTNWLWRVRWLAGRLQVMGQNGALFTSTNASSWTSVNTGVTAWLDDMASVGGSLYLAGDGGVLLNSDDGYAWQPINSTTSSALYALGTLDGQLAAAGAGGSILRAQVTPFPNPVQILQWPTQGSDNLFLFAGHLDQQFQVGHSTNLVDWIGSRTLEITDPAGVLVWLDSNTNDDGKQFYATFPP